MDGAPVSVSSKLLAKVKAAGSSVEGIAELLFELEWPVLTGIQWEDDVPTWTPEELGLDSAKVARLIRIYQPPLSGSTGLLVLEFDGAALPKGAVRRVIEQFVQKARRKEKGTRPAWISDRLIVLARSTADAGVWAIGLHRNQSRTELRHLYWSAKSTPSHLQLLAERDLPHLAWRVDGPTLTEGFGSNRTTIRSAAALATRMAEVARDIRENVSELLAIETAEGPLTTLLGDFRKRLLPGLTPAKFADVYAQTMVYGLLSARVTHPELFNGTGPLLGIRFSNELLDAIYSRLRERSGDLLDDLGIEELALELSQIDVEQILAEFGSKDRRMDPVVYLYEEFLKQYDSKQRMEAGAFYTPLPVVQFMTKAVDQILKTQFGLPLGISDPSDWETVCRNLGIALPDDTVPDRPFVSMIDPATGTGTFLMEWIRVARESYIAVHGQGGWAKHFEEHVAPAMHAFELMLAPYAIAHLKFAVEGHAAGIEEIEPTIVLTDTLQHPAIEGTPAMWNETEDDPISIEADRADELKTRERFTIVIGNPPYSREQGVASGEQRGGGVVRFGVPGIKPLIDDLTGPMSKAGQGVHIKNLYNDYVYFWRWATWRATKELGEGPGVVAMITAASYLGGKSMSGLRAHLRDVFDDFYVIDLGGDGRGASAEDNVFDIRTSVAIGIGVRRTGRRDSSVSHVCSVHYVRMSGTRDELFDALEEPFEALDFQIIPGVHLESFAPSAGGAYAGWPTIGDLFPFSQSGAQAKRTWPISASENVLDRRWKALLAADDRATALREASDLNLSSERGSLHGSKRLAPLKSLRHDADHDGIVRYGFRSFDRQHVLADPRVFTYPRREFWSSRSDRQLFLTTVTSATLGHGPVLNATPYVPDLHYFRNRGAKDVFPLWTDGAALMPNLGPMLLDRLHETLGEGIDADVFVQYLYGLGGTAAFSERFAAELAMAAGPVHLPVTKDRALFDKVVELGRELLAWHTWGGRYADEPIPPGAATELSPIKGRPERFTYDPVTRTISGGGGTVGPVSAEVWGFEVSGFKPLQSWLGYRQAKKKGKSSSPLDAISYDEWTFTQELLLVINILQHTVDLTPRASALLDRVVAGDIFTAEELM
jgi:hypothetical protein